MHKSTLYKVGERKNTAMETTNKILSRKEAREFVYSMLFAKSFLPNEPVDEFYQKEIENAEVDLGTQCDYIKNVFFEVFDNLEEIDAKIEAASEGWTLGRLSKSSLAIMRLCVCEMMNINDVPKSVALNEAIELAKKFDDDNAPAFINGVLNKIAHQLPTREIDK